MKQDIKATLKFFVYGMGILFITLLLFDFITGLIHGLK